MESKRFIKGIEYTCNNDDIIRRHVRPKGSYLNLHGITRLAMNYIFAAKMKLKVPQIRHENLAVTTVFI